MRPSVSFTLASGVLILVALASFFVGFRFTYIKGYVLVQFALACAWFVTAAVTATYWTGTARVAVWTMIVVSGVIALLYPAQIVYLRLSFALHGFV